MDLVQASEGAGVRLAWLRRRDAGDSPGHVIELQPQSEGESPESRGPYDRATAQLVFSAMETALLVAARQQRARLRGIVDRRAEVSDILAGRK